MKKSYKPKGREPVVQPYDFKSYGFFKESLLHFTYYDGNVKNISKND